MLLNKFFHSDTHFCNFDAEQLEEIFDFDVILSLPSHPRHHESAEILSQLLVGNTMDPATTLAGKALDDQCSMLETWVDIVKSPDTLKRIAYFAINNCLASRAETKSRQALLPDCRACADRTHPADKNYGLTLDEGIEWTKQIIHLFECEDWAVGNDLLLQLCHYASPYDDEGRHIHSAMIQVATEVLGNAPFHSQIFHICQDVNNLKRLLKKLHKAKKSGAGRISSN